ncbi:MAG: DinB family protein [Acidobacteriota bacterium]
MSPIEKPEPSPLDHLLRLLDEGYAKLAWHGPNLRGSLRGVTPEQAGWRPARGRHNIWEIAVHAAYWKYAVRRRLTGARRGSFVYPGSNWFARPDRDGTISLRRDLAVLEEEHRLLRETVAEMAPERLGELSPKKKWTLGDMIAGIAMHDVYHAGQIQLLKRLQKKR